MERVAKPANELEGLLRNRLPDAVRRRLTDVIIERSEGIEPNWTAQPVWSGHLSHHDKRVFIRALFEVRRDHLLLTDD
jgi:hypothetical protein